MLVVSTNTQSTHVLSGVLCIDDNVPADDRRKSSIFVILSLCDCTRIITLSQINLSVV